MSTFGHLTPLRFTFFPFKPNLVCIWMTAIDTGHEIYNFHNSRDRHRVACSYVHMCMSGFSLIMLSGIFVFAVVSFHNIQSVIHSFNSNIDSDMSNFNEFLDIIPEIKSVIGIIINLCETPLLQPYCNSTDSNYIQSFKI